MQRCIAITNLINIILYSITFQAGGLLKTIECQRRKFHFGAIVIIFHIINSLLQGGLAGLIIEVVDALEFVRPSARSRCYKFYVVKIRPLNAVLRQQRFGKHKEEKMKWRRLVLFVDAIEADIRKGKQLEPPQKRLFWRTLEGSEKGWKEGSKQS